MAAARTGTTPTAGAASENEFSSAAQRERRQRILDATLTLASRGGYEAVQMRAVADRAGVALGTLYRYFPSKIHLLVSGLAREFERNQEKLDRLAIPGDTPYDRMLFVLCRVTRAIAISSAVGSPSCMARVNMRSISRATVLTSAAALGSANMNARVIASVSIGSRCIARVTRPSTNSIRSYGVSPGIARRSSFSWFRSNSRASPETSR